MGLTQDIKVLEQRCKDEYEEYKKHSAIMKKGYEDKCDEFNNLINTINTERMSLRQEIRILYDFLQRIGGSLGGEKKISIFDFKDEKSAPNQSEKEVEKPDIPCWKEFQARDVLDNLLTLGIAGIVEHAQEKIKYEEFLQEVEDNKNKYEKDIAEKTTWIEYMKDAVKIAEIYRNVVVTVRDTVAEKIIPELNVIHVFLYADAIRERVLEGEDLEGVEPCNIMEYKGTKQDVHYQFVKNTFDFYRISTAFFKQTVLTDILSDMVVSEKEKRDFYVQIDAIKKQIAILESKKVI